MNNRILQLCFLFVAALILTAASCKNGEGDGSGSNGGTDSTITDNGGGDKGNTDTGNDNGSTGQGNSDSGVPANLLKLFTEGEISKCMLNGTAVYHCRLNANDAGSEIFDMEGEKMHVCNSAWGQTPDPECDQLTECDVLWRVKDNIWGLAPVDNLNGDGGQ